MTEHVPSAQTFRPARRGLWLALYSLATLVLLAGVALSGWYAYEQVQTGQGFPWWAVATGVALLPLPWLGYGLYLLLRSRYRLDEQGLHVQWGGERHLLPWEDLTWAGLLRDYPSRVEMPPALWPGLRYGTGLTEEGRPVRAFALQGGRPVLVETERICWLLTPARPAAFLRQVAAWVETTTASGLPPAKPEPPATDQKPAAPEETSAIQEPEAADTATIAETKAPSTEEGQGLPTQLETQPKSEADLSIVGAVMARPIPAALLQDRTTLAAGLSNLLLNGALVLLWWWISDQGHPLTLKIGYVLVVLAWLVGLNLALGIYGYHVQKRAHVQALWFGSAAVQAVFLAWLAFHALF